MADIDINDMDRCAKVMLKLRDKHEAIGAAAKKEQAEVKEKMDTLARHMLTLMGNTTSQGTSEATVMKVVKQKFWSTDWDAFKKFVVETDNLDLFEHRIAQKNMATYLEKNPDKIPAGLQIDRRFDITVRRLPKKPQ